jgi:hypothetical protein
MRKASVWGGYIYRRRLPTVVPVERGQMLLKAGAQITTLPSAFSGEMVDWNDRVGTVLSYYGKVNREDAYIVALDNGTRILVATSRVKVL